MICTTCYKEDICTITKPERQKFKNNPNFKKTYFLLLLYFKPTNSMIQSRFSNVDP